MDDRGLKKRQRNHQRHELGDACGPQLSSASNRQWGEQKQGVSSSARRSRRRPPDGATARRCARNVTRGRSGGKPAGSWLVAEHPRRRTPPSQISPSAPHRAQPGRRARSDRQGQEPQHRQGSTWIRDASRPAAGRPQPTPIALGWIDQTRPPPSGSRNPAVEMPAPAKTVRIRGFPGVEQARRGRSGRASNCAVPQDRRSRIAKSSRQQLGPLKASSRNSSWVSAGRSLRRPGA